MDVKDTPFAVIRGRSILKCLILAVVAGIFWGEVFIRLVSTANMAFTKSADLAFGLSSYGFLALLIRREMSRAKLPFAAVSGRRLNWLTLRRYALLAFPLVVFSVAAMYALYLPLSYVAPRFVQWWVFDIHVPLWTDDSLITNVMFLIEAVLLAPAVEELVFRGVLLNRWSLKWNVPRGIFMSSMVFALGHEDFIGAFFFGYVMSVVYIQTRSLYAPICIHVANNALVCILDGIMLIYESDGPSTIAELQSTWLYGLAAAIIVAPWVIKFIKHYFSTNDWIAPYLRMRS